MAETHHIVFRVEPHKALDVGQRGAEVDLIATVVFERVCFSCCYWGGAVVVRLDDQEAVEGEGVYEGAGELLSRQRLGRGAYGLCRPKHLEEEAQHRKVADEQAAAIRALPGSCQPQLALALENALCYGAQ